MKPDVITTIENEVRHLADRLPDAVYEAPHYFALAQYTRGRVRNGPTREGCLIGQAIRVVIPGSRKIMGQMDAAGDVDLAFVLDELDVEVGVGDLGWLRYVQGMQDRGTPWGEAVAKADNLENDD